MNRRLCGIVRRGKGQGHNWRDAANVDDAALGGDELLRKRLDDAHRPQDVDVKDVADVAVNVRVQRRAVLDDAGVVDEHVQRAARDGGDLRRGGLDRRCLRDLELDNHYTRPQKLRDAVRAAHGAKDKVALSVQLRGERAADAADASACDECRLLAGLGPLCDFGCHRF